MRKLFLIALFIITALSFSFFFRQKQLAEKIIFVHPKKSIETAKTSPLLALDKKPETKEIIYTDAGFKPTVTSIFSGDTVIFKNKSSKSFQPIPDPKSENTTDLTFGATTTIPKKGEYQFTFTQKGECGYYDTINPTSFGVIIVK